MKQFLHNLVRKLPFRMFLGKMGIHLMSVGRSLQVRYANWNDEFRLGVTNICYSPASPDTDDHILCFHVSRQVLSDAEPTFLTFVSPSRNKCSDRTRNLVQALFAIRGVEEVRLHRYHISVSKAHVYNWRELRPQIEAVLLSLLTENKQA